MSRETNLEFRQGAWSGGSELREVWIGKALNFPLHVTSYNNGDAFAVSSVTLFISSSALASWIGVSLKARAGKFDDIRRAATAMASIHEPTSPGNNYSNLEAIYPTEAGHLSLQPGYRNGDEGTEGKETWQGVEEVSNGEAAGVGGFMSRRYWGRSARTLLIIAAVLLAIAVIIGATVGGVMTTRSKKNKAPPPSPEFTTSPPSSSTQTSTTPTTPTIVSPVTSLPPGLLFSPENWYTFNNNDGVDNYWIQTYADDTSAGRMQISKNYSDTAERATDMQFQIRPVPATWNNYSYKAGGEKHRTYWISCRSSGPGARLTMEAVEWERIQNGISSQLHFHPKPSNKSDGGQYWYFNSVDGPGGDKRYELYNMKAGPYWPVAFESTWGNPLIWAPAHPESWSQWRAEPRSRIVNDDEEFTWEIDSGPDVDDYVPDIPG